MKRKRYWPVKQSQQVLWLNQFANALERFGPELPLSPETIEAGARDARRLGYVLGPWYFAVQKIGGVGAAIVRLQAMGEEVPGQGPVVLPEFAPPPPPPGAEPVKPGALRRIFRLVKMIKASPGYTPRMGIEMGIVGPEDSVSPDVPVFRMKAEGESGRVRIRFQKGDHAAVCIESRRGGGAFERLAVDARSPFVDERPLLVPGQPEIREYRMRFFEDASPVGNWSPVARIIVG